jgi:hypothetical protein
MISFEWDEVKAETNRQKHGITFSRAKFVFEDPFALTEQDRIVTGELRWQTVGLVEGVAILLVAHTIIERGEDELIRIVSARLATRQERNRYEENRKNYAE